MIISCPECDTSFNLPDSRVTPKGSKVRCSKCRHVFRVRSGPGGEPEIYYKNEGVADPPTQELGDLFDDGNDDDDATQFGAPAHAEVDEDFDTAARRTMIGMPAQTKKKSKSASSSFDPFPLAGLVNKKKIPAEEEPGIDLFDGEDPVTPVQEEAVDPFAGAFEEEEPSPILAAQDGPRDAAAPVPEPVPAPAPAPVAPVEIPLEEGELSDVFLGKKVGEFGPADELVDPNFGQDGVYFDPEAGKVDNHTKPPPAAAKPPAPRPSGRQPAPAKKVVPQVASPDVEDWDVEPHNIGGGGFQKFMNFVFILLIVLIGALGYVAFRSDGMLDFKNPEPMVHILMHKAEFTPRKEWQKEAPPIPTPPVKPLIASNLFARLVPLKEGHLLLVQGTVSNQTDEPKSGAKVRVMILDASEKILREETVSVGQVASLEALSALASPADTKALNLGAPVTINPKSSEKFMVIIGDVPKSVQENKHVSYRVEMAE